MRIDPHEMLSKGKAGTTWYYIIHSNCAQKNGWGYFQPFSPPGFIRHHSVPGTALGARTPPGVGLFQCASVAPAGKFTGNSSQGGSGLSNLANKYIGHPINLDFIHRR